MPKPEDPRERLADSADTPRDPADLISLVDLFDQLDRDAFRRSLGGRKRGDHPIPQSRVPSPEGR